MRGPGTARGIARSVDKYVTRRVVCSFCLSRDSMLRASLVGLLLVSSNKL